MALTNAPDRFGLITRALHWATAAGVLGMLGLGTLIARMEVSLSNLWLIALHKSLGFALLALVLARIAWHRLSPPPRPLPSAAPWQDRLARNVHRAFYALLLLVPLSGWGASAASGLDVLAFGVRLPAILPADPAVETALFAVHAALTKLLAALVLVHVAGVAKRAAAGDGTLRRMLRGA